MTGTVAAWNAPGHLNGRHVVKGPRRGRERERDGWRFFQVQTVCGGEKAHVLFVTVRLAAFIIINIISSFLLICFWCSQGIGRQDEGFEHEIQLSSTFVMYFIISTPHLSVLYARPFIFHMSGFLIIVGPLR